MSGICRRGTYQRIRQAEPIDLSAHDQLGELVAEVLGVPEVDCAIDCVGFEAKGQGSDGHVVEAPAVVLNGLMKITRPAGSIGHSRPLRDR